MGAGYPLVSFQRRREEELVQMGQREGVGEAENVAWVQLRSGSIGFHLRFYAVVFVQRCMLIHRQTGFSVGPEFPQQVRGFQSPGESSPLSGHLPEALIGPLEGVGPSEPVSGLTCPGPRPQLGPQRRHFWPRDWATGTPGGPHLGSQGPVEHKALGFPPFPFSTWCPEGPGQGGRRS